jgi:hypothetical protein
MEKKGKLNFFFFLKKIIKKQKKMFNNKKRSFQTSNFTNFNQVHAENETAEKQFEPLPFTNYQFFNEIFGKNLNLDI